MTAVITSRNETTLITITVIAAYLLIVYALLEKLRSAILVRLGLSFDAKSREALFGAVLKASIPDPSGGSPQMLRDLETIREFLTGAGLLSFCDAPWVPIFVAAASCFTRGTGYRADRCGSNIWVGDRERVGHARQLKRASTHAVLAGSYASATLRNAEVLHAMGMLPGLRDRWLAKQDAGLHLQAVASDRAGYLIAATKFIRAFLQVAILGIGAYLAITQEASPGAMIAASIIMGRALAPVEMAVANWKWFIAARSAYDRIRTVQMNAGGQTKMRCPPHRATRNRQRHRRPARHPRPPFAGVSSFGRPARY